MMKKFFWLMILFLVVESSQAKYVRFSVDMSGQAIDSGGIHITGNFQSEAGYPGGDWQPNTTEMDSIGNMIYMVVVNIPAFAEYEYKFINGSGTYGLEFVPFESRVEYVTNDNRWIYIDSLNSDTMDIGAIRFSGNAPMGKYLLRLKVDMQLQTLNAAGCHVEGGFNFMSPTATYMYSFDGMVHQYIAYIDTTNTLVQFKYVNGNTLLGEETVPVDCQFINTNRGLTLPKDSVLPVVCFNYCTNCTSIGVHEIANENQISIYPNPTSSSTTITWNGEMNQLIISDISGHQLLSKNISSLHEFLLDENFSAGIYLIQLANNNTQFMRKLIVQ